MNKFTRLLFSSRLMAIVIVAFAISIAVATFIENDFGSTTARAVIYNSWWFTLMLFIGIVNLTGTILINQLYRKEKLSLFIFHLAFLLILTGAAITHYFGFEGFMHIRSGETSNRIVSSNNYFQLRATVNGLSSEAERQVYLSALSRNRHRIKINVAGKKLMAEILEVIPNAEQTITSDPNGKPMIQIVIAGSEGRQNIILTNHQSVKIGDLVFSFNDTTKTGGISIISDENGLSIKSPFKTPVMNMAAQTSDTLISNKFMPFQLLSLYNFNGLLVVGQSYNPSGKIVVTSAKDVKTDEYPDVLKMRITSGGQSDTLSYFARHNSLNPPVVVSINGINAVITFGAKEIQLSFSLLLKKFILERYPGSKSPSWFESRVELTDSKAGFKKEQRIYMNNILKYKGYRFYQSSYDSDEGGTIFSVNHDYLGTLVTYAGYLMLALGIGFSLLNRNSRFRKLSVQLTRLRENRKVGPVKAIVVVLLVALSLNSFAQTTVPDSVYIDREHAASFGRLLIQDPGGRIKPVNTLSSELLRKVSRETQFLGQTSDQVFLGMLAFPEYWQNVPMIRVSHPEIQKILKTREHFVAFSDVINFNAAQNPYILSTYVNDAYQKKPAYRSTFDNEMIRLDERVNLCYQIYNGNLLRIFPKRNDRSHTWYSPAGLTGVFKGNDSVMLNSIVPLYLRSLKDAAVSHDYTTSNDALKVMHEYQNKFGAALIPSSFKIKLEALYNRLNLFDRIGSVYGMVGFVLLIFQFMSIFLPRLNLKPVIRIATVVIVLCFTAHLAGLITRWFISGHAPWSNGYESLVYIAFATVLAGIIFSGKSSITLSVTSLLAWIILFVAHLNWMDPEITNLVPVLKSYWLLIHVAIITASYGFLALGALLSFINLILMISQTKSNLDTTSGIISELSIVIEMTLIIGLYMLTIGTFLGGVWANESWGRYWGWDPKETWALVSVLVYAFVAHMRLVPGLQGNYLFNLMGLLGFSSIIMTYFGVNYYLSGLHSYAKGDPLPIPTFVYYTVAIVGLVAILAWVNHQRMNKISKG